jgi:hypothetical protein
MNDNAATHCRASAGSARLSEHSISQRKEQVTPQSCYLFFIGFTVDSYSNHTHSNEDLEGERPDARSSDNYDRENEEEGFIVSNFQVQRAICRKGG